MMHNNITFLYQYLYNNITVIRRAFDAKIYDTLDFQIYYQRQGIILSQSPLL